MTSLLVGVYNPTALFFSFQLPLDELIIIANYAVAL